MTKVKAHSGVEYNEVADKLAKDGISHSICEPDIQSLSSVNAVGCWKTNQIEVPFRGFTKKIGTTKHTAEWRLLNRNLDSISNYKSQQISWEITWKTTSLFYRERQATSDKETRERAFNMKILNNELPTMERMFDRFPSIYKDNKCVRCTEKTESQMHVFTCTKNLVDINMCRDKFIKTLINQINITASNASGIDLKEKVDSIQEIEITKGEDIRNPNEFSFQDILFGLIPTALYELIYFVTDNKEETDKILEITMEKFKRYIYKQIWVRRCQDVKHWEISNGIKNNKQKKNVLASPSSNIISINNSVSNKINKKNYRDKNNIKNICINLVNKYIIRVVQSNINWTGLYTIGCSAGP